MESNSSRERMLQKIRKALAKPVPLPFPEQDGSVDVYTKSTEDLSVDFASEFTRLLGNFAYCSSVADLYQQLTSLVAEKAWKELYCAEPEIRKMLGEDVGNMKFSEISLAQSDASITSCEALVARTGSIVLSSAMKEGRTASVYAPVHICVARTSQLVWDISDALQMMQNKYPDGLPSMLSFATGPSRTADIEKTLVVGVHGPKEVYCFLLEDAS
jgi:L-lactate dehydrogenase complex protein LldG